jgi:hypothetical protein
MYPYTPLWKRGARGDFLSIILKSPFIPLCQRGIKTSVTEGLQNKGVFIQEGLKESNLSGRFFHHFTDDAGMDVSFFF